MSIKAYGAFEAKPPWRIDEYESMTCVPFKLDKERDPVVRTHVSGEFDPDTGEIKSLTVMHELLSGAKFDRSEQYIQTELRQTEPNKTNWIWRGQRKNNREQTMIGKLRHDNKNNWYYNEYLYWHGLLKYHYASKCQENED